MSQFSPDIDLVHALKHSSDLIAISNFDSYFTQLNKKWEEVTGYTIEELTSRPLFEFIHPEDREMSEEEANELFNGKPETIKFENRYIKKNGEVIWLEWNSVMDYDLRLSFSIAREITDYKVASLFGNKAKELMTSLVSYASDLPSKDEYIDYTLQRLLDLYGADCISFWDYDEHNQSIHCTHSQELDDIPSRKGLSLSRSMANSYFDAILNQNLVIAPDVMNDPSTVELKAYFEEYGVKSLLDGIVNEGLSKCILCIESSTYNDWTNQASNTLMAISNIVSNYLNGQQLLVANNSLRQALNEKNILFKELHHRIKNNLNMVANLLSLKSRITNSPDLIEFIMETRNRIYSISKTHDQLLKLEELDQLNVKEYILDLINNVINTYTTRPQLYPVAEDIENHKIDVDIILSLGLLTNEIVSNIIKYAYDPKTGGEIQVSFVSHNSMYIFEIGDQGAGFESKESDSLGLTLIELLSKQINGSLEVKNDSGVSYKIIIPAKE